MNIINILSISRCSRQMSRSFYSVSSSLIGPPPEGIGLGNNNYEISNLYKKNKEALGNNVHSLLRDTIQKYHLLSIDKTIETTSEGLSSIENTIQNLEVKTSDKKTKKILEIEIHNIRQQFGCLLDILGTLQNQNDQEKE